MAQGRSYISSISSNLAIQRDNPRIESSPLHLPAKSLRSIKNEIKHLEHLSNLKIYQIAKTSMQNDVERIESKGRAAESRLTPQIIEDFTDPTYELEYKITPGVKQLGSYVTSNCITQLKIGNAADLVEEAYAPFNIDLFKRKLAEEKAQFLRGRETRTRLIGSIGCFRHMTGIAIDLERTATGAIKIDMSWFDPIQDPRYKIEVEQFLLAIKQEFAPTIVTENSNTTKLQYTETDLNCPHWTLGWQHALIQGFNNRRSLADSNNDFCKNVLGSSLFNKQKTATAYSNKLATKNLGFLKKIIEKEQKLADDSKPTSLSHKTIQELRAEIPTIPNSTVNFASGGGCGVIVDPIFKEIRFIFTSLPAAQQIKLGTQHVSWNFKIEIFESLPDWLKGPEQTKKDLAEAIIIELKRANIPLPAALKKLETGTPTNTTSAISSVLTSFSKEKKEEKKDEKKAEENPKPKSESISLTGGMGVCELDILEDGRLQITEEKTQVDPKTGDGPFRALEIIQTSSSLKKNFFVLDSAKIDSQLTKWDTGDGRQKKFAVALRGFLKKRGITVKEPVGPPVPGKYIAEPATLKSLPATIHAPRDKNNKHVIGDLHGNALKLLHFLIRQGLLTLKNPEDYKEFVTIYSKSIDELNEGHLQSFETILANAKCHPDAGKLLLIGDELADRGSNDYFTLKILEKLQGKIPVEILFSNHGVEFLKQHENKNFDAPFNNCEGSGQGLSATRLQKLITKELKVNGKIINFNAIDELVKNCYKPNLKLLTYTLSEDKNHITIFSHAPIGSSVISGMLMRLGIDPNALKFASTTRAEKISKWIDEINIRVEQQKTDPSFLSNFKEKVDINGLNANPYKHPYFYIIWKRASHEDLQHDRSQFPFATFVHGHTGTGGYRENVINLENSFGYKNEFTGELTAFISDLRNPALTLAPNTPPESKTAATHIITPNTAKETARLAAEKELAIAKAEELAARKRAETEAKRVPEKTINQELDAAKAKIKIAEEKLEALNEEEKAKNTPKSIPPEKSEKEGSAEIKAKREEEVLTIFNSKIEKITIELNKPETKMKLNMSDTWQNSEVSGNQNHRKLTSKKGSLTIYSDDKVTSNDTGSLELFKAMLIVFHEASPLKIPIINTDTIANKITFIQACKELGFWQDKLTEIEAKVTTTADTTHRPKL